MKKIIGLGAEAHATVVMELIERAGTYEIEGVVNDDESITMRTMRGSPVLAGSQSLPQMVSRGCIGHFFLGLSSLRSREKRRSLYLYALECGLKPFTVIHPRAVVSSSADIGRGACILAGAILSTESRLWENVTVNIGAMIESHCDLRPHVQLGAGSYIGCGAHVGEGSYIGNGAFVQPNVHIGENVVIGPGAVVAEDIADGQVVPAVPRYLAGQNRTKPNLAKTNQTH